MKKKPLKIILIIVVIAVLGYKSVYIKKLDEVKNVASKTFDAAAFSKKLWNEKMPAKIDSVVELSTLIGYIQSNPNQAFKQYSNAIDIGNYRYSLIKTTGVVSAVNEDEVLISISNNSGTLNATIETEFIYGNALRDASGLVDVKDFTNTGDLNNIGQELNNIVKNEVIPPFKKTVKKGEKVMLVAAIKMNKEHVNFNNLELIPVRIQILP